MARISKKEVMLPHPVLHFKICEISGIEPGASMPCRGEIERVALQPVGGNEIYSLELMKNCALL